MTEPLREDVAERGASDRRAAGRRDGDPAEATKPRRDGRGEGGERTETGNGFYLYGVTRAGAWRAALRPSSVGDDLLRIRYRDLEALVRAVPFALPEIDRDRVQDHQRVIWNATQRDTLLPAPAGIVFRGRRAVIRFLQEQYIPLDEGIALVDGNWELRLHIKATMHEARAEAKESALHIYSELRRFARAAFPFAHEDEHVLSAAFLVSRDTWLQFWDQAEELGRHHAEIVVDLTGPWPPYDFVRMSQ